MFSAGQVAGAPPAMMPPLMPTVLPLLNLPSTVGALQQPLDPACAYAQMQMMLAGLSRQSPAAQASSITLSSRNGGDPPNPLRSDLITRLRSNGDINFWDSEIERAARDDPDAKNVQVLLERGENRLKVLSIPLPAALLSGINRQYAIRYLTASVYNVVVSEGASHIVFLMDDKEEEKRITSAVSEELSQRYERFRTYGNMGLAIEVHDSSNFAFTVRKELTAELPLSTNVENDRIFMGVDVGGTNIKTVVIQGGKIVYKNVEEVDHKGGGEVLKDQVIEEIKRARKWVSRHLERPERPEIDSLGLTFPSPVRKNDDGTVTVVRLTNYERYWSEARGGDTDFKKDYEAINGIVDDIRRLHIRDISILNDADAFGFGEIWRRIESGVSPGAIGTKVVLPIGTGPGYVKIKNGEIENIPNQGGHMVIDLSDSPSVDPGCEVGGCYGGYVPASAFDRRARHLGFDLTGRDGFVPKDLDSALQILADIADKIAAASVKIHKITGADEVILAGGISNGFTGVTLASAVNDVVARKYPEYQDKVKITLSQSDRELGGAVGAAHYGRVMKDAKKTENVPPWDMTHRLPAVQMGKNIIAPFFAELAAAGRRPGILITKELDEHLSRGHEHLWYQYERMKGHVVVLDPYEQVESVTKRVVEGGYDAIVPLGAGTVTDWGKHVGSVLEKEVIVIPTTLSSNGMFTEKAIFYPGKGADRKRHSSVSGPPARVLIDFAFLMRMLSFTSATGIEGKRANRTGAGDIVSIYPALLDWKLAVTEGKERWDQRVADVAEGVFRLVEENAEAIRDNTDLGMMVLAEAMAEASLLNMRFGTSRPKDGSEHLLADEIDKRLTDHSGRLHGEQVAVTSLVMAYLFSTNYDTSAFTRVRSMMKRLGLPMDLAGIGVTKDMFVDAISQVTLRPDKYTYFDKNGQAITRERAEQIYETVFGSRRKEIVEFLIEACRYVNNAVNAMFAHIQEQVIPNLDAEKTNELVDLLLETKRRNGRVIVNAAGRVGEVAVFFQQKLRALGFIVDDLKEITPEFLVNPDDLVLTLSGSGLTASVVDNLERVDTLHREKGLGRQIFSITANPDVATWKIGPAYHKVMEIRGRSKNDLGLTRTEGDLYLPLSSTFEYSTALYLEGIVELLTDRDVETLDPGRRIDIVRKVVEETPSGIKSELTEALQKNEFLTAGFTRLLLKAVAAAPKGNGNQRQRVYLFGLGQNNYVIRLFARRIQNMGFEVYVPGPRDIVSSGRKGDIAIFVSNSGNREIMLRKMRKAREIGTHTVVITADPDSGLAQAADMTIPISSKTTRAHTVDIMDDSVNSRDERKLKRSFEIAAMFYLEGVSVALMNLLQLGSKDLMHVAKEWE